VRLADVPHPLIRQLHPGPKVWTRKPCHPRYSVRRR
jgi:hypothetical protein